MPSTPSAHSAPSTAIILAAGKAAPSIAAVFGETSVALLPLNGRPIIHWSASYLREVGVRRVLLGLRPEDQALRQFAAHALQRLLEVECVEILEDRGPGYTLACCLERLAADDPVLVVLGDTIFTFPPPGAVDFGTSFVLTHPAEDVHRWCFAESDESGKITGLLDKPGRDVGTLPALIGVYYLHEAGPAQQALALAAAQGERSIQLSAALAPYIQRGALRAVSAGDWFDCGNLDLLTDSRRRLLQTRSFNAVEVDALRGTVTKRSANRHKFVNEINYYRLLPPDLAVFFPRLVDHSLLPDDTHLTLEYYGYQTLSELWVFERFDAAYWRRIFARLAEIIDQFGRYTLELPAASVFQFYWLKTLDRIEAFAGQHETAAALVNTAEWTIDGVRMAGWPRLRPLVEQRLHDLAGTARGQIIHGDFCLPNILFDPLNRVVKLIDPRGSFGEAGIFGDARYDVAKLLHSLRGGYDFFVHDMFRVALDGAAITLEQFFPDTRPAVLAEFAGVFGPRYSLAEVEFLEALLFVSMPTLHHDAPARQTAMFATGLKLLNQALTP